MFHIYWEQHQLHDHQISHTARPPDPPPMTSKSKSYDDILPVLWQLVVSTRNIHTVARQTHTQKCTRHRSRSFLEAQSEKKLPSREAMGEGGETRASVPSPATFRRPHILAPTSIWGDSRPLFSSTLFFSFFPFFLLLFQAESKQNLLFWNKDKTAANKCNASCI